ncbi:MAG: sodium:proton antiporter [Candidatus Aminicenantes bacterium]|nr:sodium:proton antiporter [Candidatus Aminicenantes bacterium]
MIGNKDNPIVVLISRIVSPFIMLFALYIIFHGHYSPGGGFQGGTMLAASVLLIRLAMGSEIAQLQFRTSWGTPLGSIGVLIYFATGLIAMLMGGSYLNYEFLALSEIPAHTRSIGVLLVEIGVGLAVMGILVAIYDDLLEGDPDD